MDAEKREQGFRKFREELNSDIERLRQEIDKIKQKIADNQRTETHPDAMLSQPVEKYNQYLDLNYAGIQQLFELEEASMKKEAQVKIKDKKRVTNQIELSLHSLFGLL